MKSSQDYYPLVCSCQTVTAIATAMLGFNDKIKDDEIENVTGSFQDYGMRMYDARVCRFISVDPISKKYPELTPYQFASNRPIQAMIWMG